ncbi:MAG: TetR/AcrR family transcriptional regulator [Cumulibacter sp.]
MNERDVPTRLVDAAIEVLASSTSVAMPLRAVATHAAVTTGAIQHHFGTKNSLVLAAMKRHGEQVVERLQRRRSSRVPTPRQVLRAIAQELLPLDEERRIEAQVALTFEKLATNDPDLASQHREQYDLLLALLARYSPTADDAELLLCALGGLRSDLLLERITSERASTLVDTVLDRLGVE